MIPVTILTTPIHRDPNQKPNYTGTIIAIIFGTLVAVALHIVYHNMHGGV